MAETWAVIPAGGSGSRFSATQDKLLSDLAGKPVLLRTLEALISTSKVSGIVLVAGLKAIETYNALIQQAFPHAPIRLVPGGESRRASVYQGLLAVPEAAEIIVIHDAARPLVSAELIEASIDAVEQGSVGAIVAVPIVDTVKQAEPHEPVIEKTIDRTLLWRAQTPQTFRRDPIMKAHQTILEEISVTDDAQLLELAGLGPVQLIPGDERNLKITGQQDIWLAEAFLTHLE